MSDMQTVEQLFSTYAWSMDSKEFELFDEVFSEDATFVVSIAGTVCRVLRGAGGRSSTSSARRPSTRPISAAT